MTDTALRPHNFSQRVPGAITAVPQNVFVSARPVAQAAVPLPAKITGAATIVTMKPPVEPKRESLVAKSTLATSNLIKKPPITAVNRQVVTKLNPPIQSKALFSSGPLTTKNNLTRPVNARKVAQPVKTDPVKSKEVKDTPANKPPVNTSQVKSVSTPAANR